MPAPSISPEARKSQFSGTTSRHTQIRKENPVNFVPHVTIKVFTGTQIEIDPNQLKQKAKKKTV